ncbi:hypothetical protein ASPZODRAFT_132195 [Penicilliopsis zonata CBS 506.65]|uniref:Elongation factor 2 n=1 Tax=Penicilliopsis zonata CBS 506.65 TaxID=1073090 RepID=A0A1L9SJ53_9EURO|nr:hypothetical protein ASPZODRAFT_132195 [Penicilliopsis zonata CBS 506.65]OJJ47228.1 hypothetical protein ASPZODRAFT_132195 [Penicilliopsis zonata CBS 506.65]
MATTSITAEYSTPNPSFNWFFLLELSVSGILVLFFLLYFNRLFATLISYGIRAYTWHYYRAYVDIKALNISLLGGRIFFKDIRYHGVNETIFVHGGFITWQYWARAVQRSDLSKLNEKPSGPSNSARNAGREGDPPSVVDGEKNSGLGEQGGVKKSDKLPCRITVTFFGLEWFVYNRTPAYDSILAGFGVKDDQAASEDEDHDPPSADSSKPPKRSSKDQPVSHDGAAAGSDGNCPDSQPSTDPDLEIKGPLLTILRLLPIGLVCTKGALVIGNEYTRSVVTTTFSSATGSIDASNAGPYDLYRQIFSFDLNNLVVQLRPNPDYKQSQLTAAHGLTSPHEDKLGARRTRDHFFNYQLKKRKVWHSVRDLIPYFQKSVESFYVFDHGETSNADAPKNPAGTPGDVRWVGLSRYLDNESQNDHEGWNAVEYARFSTILESQRVAVRYFWDIPGSVPLQHAPLASSTRMKSRDINGAPPPEWGVDLRIEGGSITYGPWADRERGGLQNVFFPNFYRSASAAVPLTPGSSRQNTVFKLTIELSEETTLRIPTREPSKDWQWKGRAEAIGGSSKTKNQQQRRARNKEGEKSQVGPDIRPFGWLFLRVAPDSTITYTMDMIASSSGYTNQLALDLRDSRLSSSINHGPLWQCPRQLMTCDLSNPLGWNDLRTWKFDIESEQMELFLLRDHIFLITDLVSDWASGPPTDYYTFVPFVYNLNLSFTDLRLVMNVNDMNIISNPSDVNDNSWLVIKGKTLKSDVLIPIDKYKPEQNAVTFKVDLLDGGIDTTTPSWDTLHTFLQDKSTALLDSLSIDGIYNYYLSTSAELVDTLILDIAGSSPRLYLYGFLIRNFMTIRANYFGDEMHFRTLEEFQERAYSPNQSNTHHGLNPNRKSNDLDVILHVTADKVCALLPGNIYDRLKMIRLDAPSLEIDLRFTNYYMDLQFSLGPVRAALESRQVDGSTVLSATQLFIDSCSIHGHRLFGLPPAEPTYVCNWDFGIGRIIGECSAEFLSCLTAGLKAFDFTLDNFENALPPVIPIVLHDVTFLRATLKSVHVSVLMNEAALLVSSGPVSTKFNDWADQMFSKRLCVLIPDVTIAAVARQDLDDSKSSHGAVNPLGLIQLAVKLRLAKRTWNITEDRRLQQEHIKIHDEPTHRTPWLLLDGIDDDQIPFMEGKFDPPTIPIPSLPAPISTRSRFVDRLSGRQFSETMTKGSNRSFIDASSMRSSKKRRIHSANSASREYVRTLSVPGLSTSGDFLTPAKSRFESGIEDPRIYVRDQSTPYVSSRAKTSDANPWAIPEFSLHRLTLDTTQLPSEEVAPHDKRNIETIDSRWNLLSSPFEEGNTTHTNVFLELPEGIRGYCAPEFLHIISDFIQEFQPSHPIEVIDSLQTDVVGDIVAYEKSLNKPKTTTSLAIRVPSILVRLANKTHTQDSESQTISFLDEYIISLSNLRSEFRTRTERQKGDLLKGVKKSHTVHAAMDALKVAINGGNVDGSHGKAEFECRLGDTNFWLMSTPAVRAHLQMRAFDTVTSPKSVAHLASLVRRTTTMSDSAASAFQQSSSLGTKRLRSLIYGLTQSAASISDPSFLTRISNVLRIAPSHIRQHDSWKIISRLRNTYNNLPSDQQRTLATRSPGEEYSLPDNARSIVLSNFDQWRAWDLAHVERSYVMRRVWSPVDSVQESTAPPMYISSTIRSFRFLMDPGPKESDFTLQDLSTRVSVHSQETDATTAKKIPKQLIVVQSYCSSTALRVRWEILDLVEEIMTTMSDITLESSNSPQQPAVADRESAIELQVVMGADTGSIALDGVNVNLKVTGTALRGSLAHNGHNKGGVNHSTLLLSGETVLSEVSSVSKTLMLWRIRDPRTYFSLLAKGSGNKSAHDVKIAASCKKLRYEMKEDPLSLAHTADRLIEDEIRYISQLVKEIKSLPKPPTENTSSSQQTTQTRFHLALFSDDYRLSFCLLPSLTYIITGEVARMSVMPREDSKIEIDFDVKKNTHTLLSSERNKWNVLSILEIPPINGRIVANLLPERTEVEVDTTIELIKLQASSVRSLLGALSGSEMAHLVSDLKQNVAVLEKHLGDVLALEKTPPKTRKPSTGHEFIYKARLTMAGTEIHATTPGLSSKHYSTEMCLTLGMIQMHLDSGLDQGYPMEHPYFQIDVTRIIFDLKKREKSSSRSYGRCAIDAKLIGSTSVGESGELLRAYHLSSKKFDVELCAETATLIVDILAHLQERLKTLDLQHEAKRFKKLRQRGQTESRGKATEIPAIQVEDGGGDSQTFFDAIYTLDLNNVQISWNMFHGSTEIPGEQAEDLVFSIRHLDLSNKRTNTAKLRIEDMQLQMVPPSADRRERSLNSALMPELVFNVAFSSKEKEMRLAFQAAGKSVNLRATSNFILPASMLRDSIASASNTLREANAIWMRTPSTNNNTKRNLFGNKRLRSILVDVDFAGASVALLGSYNDDHQRVLMVASRSSSLPKGKYGQYVQGDAATTATFRAPGVALKVQFEDNGKDDPALNAELKVDASTNVLYPTLVPLIKQMTATVKEVMGEQESSPTATSVSVLPASLTPTKLQPKFIDGTPLDTKNADSILGRCKVNVGILICKQEFSLSCQPIARVAATASFNRVYVTINTVQSDDHGRFLALLVAFKSLQASVKHVYSNESTASFEVESIIMSLMNRRHLGSTKGISAILKVSPLAVMLNAKQVQDLLLFREIWVPSGEDSGGAAPVPAPSTETQAYIVQRYQQVAAASAFPWDSTISIEQMRVQLDLGPTLGKSQFSIQDLWLSSKKSSDWEQTMCIGFDSMGVESEGRMSGFVSLERLRVSTSIQWPDQTPLSGKTPLIQASIAFDQLGAKVSFDYQPFLVSDIEGFDFLMYNVRDDATGSNRERLFSILEGEKVQVFCTSLTASQALALFQACQRLVQDKQAAYEASIREIERFLRRKSAMAASGKLEPSRRETERPEEDRESAEKAPISLYTGVVVAIKTVNIGAFPSSFFDHQILKLEALDAQARFAVSLQAGKIHSALGLTLGQLRVALSGAGRASSTNLDELSIDEVVQRAVGSRGGTILKVPRLVARMETWQTPGARHIDYIFQSTFEGKVDVGWNYSRISFIRGMWERHSRALASRLGKPLAPSAVRITGGQPGDGDGDGNSHSNGHGNDEPGEEKITAVVVNVPQSRYTYTALEPPVIETPQLRDMGEATPPLEWIGLQREKLPNLTHQIIIVTLLEIAKEVEDAYEKILGSS